MAINPLTLLDGTTAYASDVESKVNPLYTDIDNTNIAAGAGILYSKLETAAIVGIANAQTITGAKTFADTKLLVGGAGVGVVTLKYANSANSRVVTIPDMGADMSVVTTTTGGNKGPLPPIGCIFPFFQYGVQGGGSPAIDIDTNFYRFCDGTANVTFSDGVARDLPDCSNRCLVGFGTENGGDIDTEAWAITAVGNANHQIDLQHSHANTASTTTSNGGTGNTGGSSASDTGNASADHTHTLSHTHAGPSHTHGYGTLYAAIGWSAGATGIAWAQTGTSVTATNRASGTGWGTGTTTQSTTTTYVYGDTGSAGTGNTGGASTATTSGVSATHAHTMAHTHTGPSHNHTATTTMTNANAGSTTQSIQPRSIRVRYIMRIA